MAASGGGGVEEKRLEFLRSIPFLQGLTDSQLRAVSSELKEEHHKQGDYIVKMGDTADCLYFIRQGDVSCHHGGEELMVILPNCALDDAAHKAEMLRLRVEGLTETHGTAISASFGVATVPETSTHAADVIPMADSALYAAKKAGKNRVACADRRSARKDPNDAPRLAATA